MIRNLCFFVLLCTFFNQTSFAAQHSLRGTVLDKAGDPIPGVSIQVKNTKQGVSTDENGLFSLQIPNGKITLIVRHVGYQTKELAVDEKQSQLRITLENNDTSLDEVVVVGYGTQLRKDVTGAVASVSGDVVRKNPVTNVAEAIAGRMPGVQVNFTDGAPNSEIVIRVRGGGSVTQDNSPLFIVDGFPVDNINDIAPTDIETIDVLKDASSTAIYGARGANGVFIITTKSAKAGKTSISYNGFGQARTLARELKVLSPYEFALAQYEYAALRGESDVKNFTKYFGVYDDLDIYQSLQPTNWQDELFGKTVYSQQHNLSIMGGTDKTKMAFSFTRNDEDGVMINSGYKRNYFNFKLQHEISNALSLDLGARYAHATTDGAGTSGGSSIRIGDGITTRPVNGLADQIIIDPNNTDLDDNDYDQFLRSMISPTELAKQDYRKRLEQTLNLNTSLSWKILKNLTYRSDFGLDLTFGNNKRYYGPLTGESRNVGGNLPLGELTKTEGNRYRWSNTLNYRWKKGDKHSGDFLIGQEMISGRGNSNFMRAKYFAETLLPERLFANMALGTLDRISTADNPSENLFSFFGRANYQYLDKYLVTLTLRADGSSKFAPGNQWGFFPAAAFAWRLSKEDFLKDVAVISDLKWRLSYGEAGNNRMANNLWRQTYVISNNRTIGFGKEPQPYWVSGSNILFNPDLRWETTITRNTGLDFSLWQGKLSGNLDAYWNTTKDLLVESDIPDYSGSLKQMQNIGQTSNKGIELGLTANIINKKDFSLSATFNIGINRSKIDALDGVDTKYFRSNWAGTDLKGIDDYILQVGRTVGLMYGYVTDGMYTVDDFERYDEGARKYILKAGVADNSGITGGPVGLRPGMLKYKDLNGDGKVDEMNDRQIIGSALPKHSGGFGFSATYKSFDLSTLFNWVYGNQVYNTGKISFNMYHRTTYGNMLEGMNSDNRFMYINPTGQVVTDLEALRALNEHATIWSPFSMGSASPSLHSWAVEDGSFLRLSNVTVGYSLPKPLISKIRLSQFRVYFTAYNVFLWTNYSGYDPEVNATRSSSYAALTPGVDYSAYPKARTYTFGINATF